MNVEGKLVGLVLSLLLFGAPAFAGSLDGGDAASAASADVFVDIVFAIDTSGSMSDEAASISSVVGDAVANLQCPNMDVWVRARFVGIDGTWPGTLFDEVAETVLTTAGDATTIDHSEDNGPVVYDFANATNFWLGPDQPGQPYAKAIVTIGDEGLQNGSPVDQADYDSGKLANDAAVANSLIVFSIIGNSPTLNAPELFTALAEGGATLGGHAFNDTGGFAIHSTDPDLQARLEEVFCTAADPTIGTPLGAPAAGTAAMAALALALAGAGVRRIRSRAQSTAK